MASCAFLLVANAALPDENARARILQGVVTGIGFIGGGAILKSEGTVRGTATAASIWSTGALGAAVAWGRLEIALLLALFNFAVLRWLTTFKGEERAGPS
jgi:putative Mg2+ transporter-C (MgtC) family protein